MARTLALQIALLLLQCGIAAAGFLTFAKPFPVLDEKKIPDSIFVQPNEATPMDLKPVLKDAPKGVYVAVGSERGFIGASLSGSATHLLLVDHDPRVVRFNRFNIGLLQLARDRSDYLYLRHHATHEELLAWLSSPVASQVESQYAEILRDPTAFGEWRKSLRFEDFKKLHAPPSTVPGQEFAYREANYLHYEDQFARTSAMAKAGRIESHAIELADIAEVRVLVDGLRRGGVPVSVLDLSNAWMSHYIRPPALRAMLTEFGTVTPPQGVTVLSSAVVGFRSPNIDPRFHGPSAAYLRWRYFGFTRDTMDKLLDNPLAFQEMTELLTKVPSPENRAYPAWPPGERMGTLDDREILERAAAASEAVNPCAVRLNAALRSSLGKHGTGK